MELHDGVFLSVCLGEFPVAHGHSETCACDDTDDSETPAIGEAYDDEPAVFVVIRHNTALMKMETDPTGGLRSPINDDPS